MSMFAATKKKIDEDLIKSLSVENTGVSKHNRKRKAERYGKYAEAAKQSMS